MKNKILKQLLWISLFFAFLFWLLLSLGLRITNMRLEIGFNILVGISAVVGLILILIYIKQVFWKAILGFIMLFTVLLSFLFGWAAPMEILDSSAENFPPRCEIMFPNGEKTFVIKARIPSDAVSDIGWIYYKNLPFIGRQIYSLRYCSSQWMDNDTIKVPASDYYGTSEKIVYAGIEFNWFIPPAWAVLSLLSYVAITFFEFFLRIIKNVFFHSS